MLECFIHRDPGIQHVERWETMTGYPGMEERSRLGGGFTAIFLQYP
jgi:hypothetical protein